jgi:hypothetical protein
MHHYRVISIAAILFLIFNISLNDAIGQDNTSKQDSSWVIKRAKVGSDSLISVPSKPIEMAPLDIPDDRGLFIISDDRKLQLRILGSIRYLMVFDNKKTDSKNTFNTAEIPIEDSDIRFPNYFNGLDQTRLGFEISRKTGKGDVFARLEMDFAGSSSFRIRHAYGQYRGLLAGQTWSLFSQVASRPTVVDNIGPTGAITVRNPQIRYTNQDILQKTTFSFALEYLVPDFLQVDTGLIQATQLIPDITARIDVELEKALFQLTGILSMLTGENMDEKIVIITGWGFAFSTKIQSWKNGKWYLQIAGGKGVTRYFHDLASTGYDALINPSNSEAFLPLSLGGYITYGHHWNSKIFSNLSYAFSQIENPSFSSGDVYHRGNSISINNFYDFVKGARIGIGYFYGERHNKDGGMGNASRINALFYYDF